MSSCKAQGQEASELGFEPVSAQRLHMYLKDCGLWSLPPSWTVTQTPLEDAQ